MQAYKDFYFLLLTFDLLRRVSHYFCRMTESRIALIIGIMAFLTALYNLIMKNKPQQSADDSFASKPLRLQAYERLVLLSERISLPSLISRVSIPGVSAREMQLLLIESIKQEYEYNVTQQVYVSTTAWNAVRNLRDQTMLIINQVANMLPPNASSADLNKQLLEVILNQQDKALHTIVLEALAHEAKQVMR
jgi:hypothetical protein